MVAPTHSLHTTSHTAHRAAHAVDHVETAHTATTNGHLSPAAQQTARTAVGGGILAGIFAFGMQAAMLGPQLAGMVVSKPAAWLHSKTNWNWAKNLAYNPLTQFDRNTKTIGGMASSIGGKVEGLLPQKAVSNFVGASTQVENTIRSTGIGGKLLEPGGFANGVERFSGKPGNWIFRQYQKLNKSGANTHFTGLQGSMEGAIKHMEESGLHTHAQGSGIYSDLKQLQSKMHSVEAVHGNSEGLRQEMRAIIERTNTIRGSVTAKGEAIQWNRLGRHMNGAFTEVGNVFNKWQKGTGYKSLAPYVAELPKRWANMSFTTAAFGAANAFYTAKNVTDSIHDGKEDVRHLQATYEEYSGQKLSEKELMTRNDLPPHILKMRHELRSTAGNVAGNIVTGIAGQAMFIRGGGPAGMAMAAAVQMGGKSLVDALMARSPSSKHSQDIRDALAAGKGVQANLYVDLLAEVDAHAKKEGLYDKSPVRVDYLALLAQAKQLSPGAALKLADDAAADPAKAQAITAEVEQILAQQKAANMQAANGQATNGAPQAGANPSSETTRQLAGAQVLQGAMNDAQDPIAKMPDLNPDARGGNVARLEAARNGGGARRNALA